MSRYESSLGENTETCSLHFSVPTYLNDISELLFSVQESTVIA